ncbi:MAG: hypothetical protein ACI9BF_000012 [Candidatus Paceibacteria bacterium]|jgi:hypothetical protein
MFFIAVLNKSKMLKIHTKFCYLAIISILTVLFFAASLSFINTANAGSADSLTGYAWSDNIGWISFNDTNNSGTVNYGVDVATGSGLFSGYAWSDNIGWISFWPGDVIGCPSGPGTCNPTLDWNTGVITGWARACAGTADAACALTSSRTDGWDGWISLSGVATDSSASTYGVLVNVTTGAFSGQAWGSTNVGWISFSGTEGTGWGVDGILPPASATLSSDPVPGCIIPNGDSTCPVDLTWSILFSSDTSVYNFSLGTTISTVAAGTEPSYPLNPGVNVIEARDGSNILRTITPTAGCSTPLDFWDSAECGTIPTLDITPSLSAGSQIIRSGESADVEIVIISDYNLTCQLNGAEITPVDLTYDSATSEIRNSSNSAIPATGYPTRQLYSKQAISIVCTVDADPTISLSGEYIIEVIGTVQEI